MAKKKSISLMKAESNEALQQRFTRFVEEYCRDFSAERAALRIGIPEDKAAFEGEMALYVPEIRQAIQDRLDTMSMSAQEAMVRMTDFARASFEPFLRYGADEQIYLDLNSDKARAKLHTIKKIKQKKTTFYGGSEGEEREDITTEIELHDAKDAVKTILSVHGKLVEKRTVDVTSGGEKIEHVTVFQLPDNGRD